MADWCKKVQKSGGEFLNPDETILAACPVAPVGDLKGTTALGAIGGVAGIAISGAARRRDRPETDTMAASFPRHERGILALSDQRWILFEQGGFSGGAKSISGQWSHDQIPNIEVEKAKMTSKVNLTFVDRSVVQLEVLNATKPQLLADAAAQLDSQAAP